MQKLLALVLCGGLAITGCGGGGDSGSTSTATWPATGKTKVDANGQALAKDASNWTCVRDNSTGLMWEVKNTTDINHLRYIGKGYTNYDIFDYESLPAGGFDTANNSSSFVAAVNAQSLCGANNWRMPTKDELAGLLTNRNDLGMYGSVYIDLSYFPDLGIYPVLRYFPDIRYVTGICVGGCPFWSETSGGIDFGNNIIFSSKRSYLLHIRLVRDS